MSTRYVYLKNGNDIVKQGQFSCESEKLKIIEKWKGLYGKKFNGLAISEDPVVKKEKYKPPKGNKYSYGRVLFNNKKGKISSVNFSGYKE
jgi:hypothetical protein